MEDRFGKSSPLMCKRGCCVDAMAEPQHFNLFRSRDLGSSSGAGHEAVSPLAKDG